MKRIAVLMTCYNRVQTTLECLRRLFAQKMPDGWAIDVWIVDDASPDMTGEKVKAVYPQVHIVQGPGGLFWCRGMRLAWDEAARYADYDVFLWLNDDVMLYEDAIETLARDIERTENGSSAVWIGAFHAKSGGPEIAYTANAIGGGRAIPDGEHVIAFDEAMNGNFVWVPRVVFRKIGPIWGGYHHAFGDYDYALMLKRARVPRFCCSKALGVCPQQPERYFHLKDRSLMERVRLLFNPKGFSLHDTFWFRYRNYGIMRAVVSVAHVTLKVLAAREGRL